MKARHISPAIAVIAVAWAAAYTWDWQPWVMDAEIQTLKAEVAGLKAEMDSRGGLTQKAAGQLNDLPAMNSRIQALEFRAEREDGLMNGSYLPFLPRVSSEDLVGGAK